MIRSRILVVQGLVGMALAACGPQAAPPSAPVSGGALPAAQSANAVERVSRWSRESAQADREAVQDTVALLRQAREALGQPRGADRATETLERAESRLLTRDMPAGTEGRAMNEGPQAQIVAARRALAAGNRAGAIQAVDQAIAMLQRG